MTINITINNTSSVEMTAYCFLSDLEGSMNLFDLPANTTTSFAFTPKKPGSGNLRIEIDNAGTGCTIDYTCHTDWIYDGSSYSYVQGTFTEHNDPQIQSINVTGTPKITGNQFTLTLNVPEGLC